jgi:hypothetical protein
MKETRKVISVTITTSDPAYSAGDQVGVLLTFSHAVDAAGGCAIVESLQALDKDKQNAALTLLLFSRAPTVVADNAAENLSDADMANCLGKINIATGDWESRANGSVATLKNIGLVVKNDDDKSGTSLQQHIYGVLVATGTPDWTAAANLVLKLGVRS